MPAGAAAAIARTKRGGDRGGRRGGPGGPAAGPAHAGGPFVKHRHKLARP